jgi:predicted PurR-regulated permease PerM
MAQRYNPPKQSTFGQFFDVALLLVFVFGALYLPIYTEAAAVSRVEKLPAGVTYETQTAADGTETKVWTGLTWESLGQNPTMQQQWEKLGYTAESAADIITMPFDYTIDTTGLIVTIIVIIGYYVFVLRVSEKEYREVIREKFE